MTNTSEESARQRRGRLIVKAYPLVVLALSVALNLMLGVTPLEVALPARGVMHALVAAAVLLVVNHTWLMTSTELTRGRFKLYATPEEWAASGTNSEDASALGRSELQRRHNAHRNTTENTVYFALLALAFILISAPVLVAQVWLIGFVVARLGYTYSYLSGKDGLRGLFMSLSLCAMYGLASYLVIGSTLS